jgi:hypothetical protein
VKEKEVELVYVRTRTSGWYSYKSIEDRNVLLPAEEIWNYDDWRNKFKKGECWKLNLFCGKLRIFKLVMSWS